MAHYPLDLERVRVLVDKQKAEGNGPHRDYGWYSLKLGTQIIRFLGPWSDNGLPFKEVWKHFSLPPANKVLTCIGPGNFPGAAPCPLCQAEEEAFKAGVKLKCRAQRRFFFNGLVRGLAEASPVVIEIPLAVHRPMLALFAQPGIDDYFHPEYGADVMIARTLAGANGSAETTYDVQVLLDRRGLVIPGDAEGTRRIVANLHDLDQAFPYPSLEKLIFYAEAERAIRAITAARTAGVPMAPSPWGKS